LAPEVLEALVVVDYFRCCCLVLMKVLVAVLQARQERQADRLGRLDPDRYYYYLSALISALLSPLTSPLALA
jgi:hypothetical protein